MAQCPITDGFEIDCIDSLGGVDTIWALGGTLSGYTVNATDEILGLTGSGTFYKFIIPKNTASFVETTTAAPANGTLFYSQALTIQLQKMDTTKRNQLKLLAKGRDTKLVYKDNNGAYWFVGLTRGAQVTAGSAASGMASGDLNGYTMTLTSEEPNPVQKFASLTAFSGGPITVE